MLRIIESRFVFLVSGIIFRAVLDAAYVFFVYPVFGYSGFGYEFSIGFYFFSWIAYISALSITPHLLQRVSDYFIASFLFSVLAPLCSIVGLAGAGVFPLIVTLSVFIFFNIFQHGSFAAKFLPVPKFSKISEGRIILLVISSAAVLILICWYIYSGAVRYFNLNLLKVYDFREASADLASVGFMAYFNAWVYNIFSIFLMSYFLYRRKFMLFVVMFFIQVFFFGVSAHKGVLFYPVMIFFIWFYFRRTRAMSIMALGFSFVVAISILLFFVFDYSTAGSLFVRRVFFVPAKLTIDYFRFFSVNDLVWWSNSVLEGFVHYPYQMSVPKEIGQFNGSGSHANNGFISSGYAHAGLLGVAIYSLIFAYFLKVLDSVVLTSDVPVWLVLCMTIVPLRFALISSDLFATMLTHGLALSLLLVLLLRRSRPLYFQ